MEKVRIVLSGVGGYGNTYVNAMLGAHDERFELVGACDPFPDSCRQLEALKAAAPFYNTLGDFYAAGGKADLCVISAPIQFHTPQITLALANGSNVLCEKPMSGDERDIPKLLEARDKAGKFVAIGYQWSHSPAMIALKRDILSGRFGKPKSLKTIVLWPRDKSYYKRGTGWAGKLAAADGTLIRDSVANNATAHYLHNLFYVLGDAPDRSLMPETVEASLARANPLEAFDTAVIRCGFGDFSALYVASHATLKQRSPLFEYVFERGRAVYPVSHEGKNSVAAYFDDGSEVFYGDPTADVTEKLWRAARVCLGEDDVICGIETAAPQVKVIAAAHKTPILNFSPELVKKNITADGKEFTYVEGLGELLNSLYDENRFGGVDSLCEK